MRNGDGKAVLPQPPEGRVEPQDKTTKEYAADLAEAQKEVGTLQWLAIKTRPDIAASCSAAASLTCGCPKACIQMCIGIWKYVAATWHYKIIVSASDEGSWTLLIATDASLGPGGGRSRSGVVVLLNGVPVHWASTRQSMTALSSCEAEVIAHVAGLKLGLAIRDMVEEASESKCQLEMIGDNMAAIATLTNEVTSWRTRHYC